MATSFSIAIGDGNRNLLLIGIMYSIPLLFVFQPALFKLSDAWLYALFFSMLACGLRHPETFRSSTLMYSLMFMLTFLYSIRLLYQGVFSIAHYMRIVKYLIFAYFGTLVIQQACVLSGSSYIFNQINVVVEEFKLNSLSPEPSHASSILIFLMFSFVSMRELQLRRYYALSQDWWADRWVWFTFLYAMLTMGSGTAFFFLPVFMLKFLKTKNILSMVPIVIAGYFLVAQLELAPVERAIKFGKAVWTLDVVKIVNADHSASFRIVPTLLYFQMFDLGSANTWFGYGVDFDKKLFPTIIPGLDEDTSAGGIFPTFLMNYGLLPMIFLFLLLRQYCFIRWLGFGTLLWLLMISPYPLNTQMAWLSLLLLAANKYFTENSERRMAWVRKE